MVSCLAEKITSAMVERTGTVVESSEQSALNTTVWSQWQWQLCLPGWAKDKAVGQQGPSTVTLLLAINPTDPYSLCHLQSLHLSRVTHLSSLQTHGDFVAKSRIELNLLNP